MQMFEKVSEQGIMLTKGQNSKAAWLLGETGPIRFFCPDHMVVYLHTVLDPLVPEKFPRSEKPP